MVAERTRIMNAKIWLIIAAGIILTACGMGVAAEDKTFTSSGQIVDGEEWNNVSIYNDDTIVDMLGGLVDRMDVYDASTLNVTGGYVSTLRASQFSNVNVSGGYVRGPRASDHASVNFSGNASAVSLSADNFGKVNMTGGTADYLGARDSGTINLYGGSITDSLGAWESGVINIFGYDLVKSNSGGRYGYGQVFGFWSDGTEFTIDLNGADTYWRINLIEVVDAEVELRPKTINLSSKGKWVNCKIWLTEDYNVADVNSETVFLEDEIPAEWIWFNEEQNVVMAKFTRSELEEILEPGEVGLTVTGYLVDGSYFVGTDTIKVVDKGRKD
jgi:hypothetical protein